MLDLIFSACWDRLWSFSKEHIYSYWGKYADIEENFVNKLGLTVPVY